MPIFITRLVAESGCSITGAFAQLGKVGEAIANRSCTSWRAIIRSVPRSKISTISESCGADLDRISSRFGSPLSDCSSGMVISSSTSAAERPSAAVWISTRGGANSGNTSTGMERSCPVPKIIIPTARAMTMKRSLMLLRTTQRIIAVGLSLTYRLPTADTELGAEEQGGSHGDDLGADRRSGGENRDIAFDALDRQCRANVRQAFRVGIGPRLPIRVVEHRAEG